MTEEPEDPGAVGEAMRSILQAHVEGLPEEIAELVRARSAARRLIEANLPTDQEIPLLRKLIEACRKAWLPLWAFDAVFAEFMEPELPDTPSQSYQARHAFLRRQLGEDCRVCWRPFHRQADFDRWDRERREAETAAAVREQAAPLREGS